MKNAGLKLLTVLLAVLFAVLGLGFAQEETFEALGLPLPSPEPAMLEVIEDRGDTVLVRDFYGEVEVPKNPQRIVALDEFTLEILLALGITPVGSVHIDSVFPPAYAELAEDVTLIRRDGGNISMERVDLLDVGVIIWLDANPEQEPLANLLYQNLRVHTQGREVFLESYTDPLGAATSFVTPLSIPYLLDGLVPRLAAAIDDDPATSVSAASGRQEERR